MCVNSRLLGIGELLLHNFKHNRHHQLACIGASVGSN